MTPSQAAGRKTPAGNPFANLKGMFTPLDEKALEISGKGLPEIIDVVADHMVENQIAAATVKCTGPTGTFTKHFVNLKVVKQHSPEFEGVTGIHHCVHLESRIHSDVVVLKNKSLS
jgi:hypothetical protein